MRTIKDVILQTDFKTVSDEFLIHHGDEDIVINDFDNNDNILMFDVCGKDDEYDGLYSIASSKYDELLGYYVDPLTFPLTLLLMK